MATMQLWPRGLDGRLGSDAGGDNGVAETMGGWMSEETAELITQRQLPSGYFLLNT